uniref:Putative internal head protein n=1 Tax=Escherichia phage UFV-AREG1 TaxID=1837867 RepID=A0A173GAD8_9CAUD
MKTYQEFIVEAKRREDELPFVSKTFDGTLADFKKIPNDKLAKLVGSISETPMNYDRFYPCDFVNDKLALIFEENNDLLLSYVDLITKNYNNPKIKGKQITN